MSVKNEPVMREASLYQSNNSLQRRDASEALAEYSARMRLRERAKSRALDVGCGDGGVTVDVLLPHLTACAQLDALDIGPEMVAHARAQHAGTRVQFLLADIAADVAEDMLGRYDHIFSFYTLHWVQQQRKALSNIASMLTAGGDCLLVFLGHMPVYDAYRLMAAQPAWAGLMADVEQFIPPYNDCAHPDLHFRRLLLASGFRRANVTAWRKVYDFEGVEVLKKLVQAVSPFNHQLDPEGQERFLEDFLDVVRDKELMQTTNNNEGDTATLRCEYTLIVAHAKAIRAVNPFTHQLDPEQQEHFLDDFMEVILDNGLMQTTQKNDEDAAVTLRIHAHNRVCL